MTATGWTWEYIDNHVTLPQVEALSRFWSHTPPVAIQLRRIARFLGLPDMPSAAVAKPEVPDRPRSLGADLHELSQMGLPIMQGFPNDPMLALLDP